MPETIAREIKHEALNLYKKGGKQVKVADDMGISTRTIRRAKANLKKYGDIEGGKGKAGPKPKLSAQMENVIIIISCVC
jgi:transposase